MKMTRSARQTLSHEFVEFIPEQLHEGVLYVSVTYATAAHRCFCGCGREVVTPLSPTDWKLAFNGETVSLFPSIGNWGFPCRSHYWIENNCVQWCGGMSPKTIEAGRARDRLLKAAYFSGQSLPNGAQQGHVLPVQEQIEDAPYAVTKGNRDRWLARLVAWWRA